jgi:uncharacterized protein YggE
MRNLVAAIFVTTIGVVPGLAQDRPAPPVIVTTGEGVVKQAPDRAFVTIAAESRARSAQEAQRMNVDAMTAVIDKIKSLGIPAEAIQTTGYNLQPQFDYANGKQTLRGYIARNSAQVRVDALAKTGEIISAAVETGATSVGDVRFDLKDRDKVEREALRRAVQDARGRADAAASGAGVTIDRVLRIEEQRDQDIVRPMRMATLTESASVQAAPAPIEAGEIEIRAHVTLTAAIR